MSTAWFFLSPWELQNNPVCLGRETAQHLRALRLREGDPLVLCDGRGRAWQARLEEKNERTARAAIIKELEHSNESPLNITLLAATTKGEKMDHLIRGAVELGVKEILPVLTRRTVVQFPPAKRAEKGARWQKIAVAAAAISRRSYLPPVHPPTDLDKLLPWLAGKELVIVPWEEEQKQGLMSLLQTLAVPPGEIILFTGPEGGISAGEMEKLNKLPPVHPVSLGPRILSAQTAPLAALSVIMALWGDLG